MCTRRLMSADAQAHLRAVSNTVQLVTPVSYGTAVHVKIRYGSVRFSAILTAAHAVGTRAIARKTKAVFSARGPYARRVVALDPDSLFISLAPCHDLAVVALASNVARPPPLLYCGELHTPPQESLLFWHHGGGLPRMRHTRGDLVVALQDMFLVNARAEGGASGSAIYTLSWELYGILVAVTDARLHRHERTYTRVVEGCYLEPLQKALRRRQLHLG